MPQGWGFAALGVPCCSFSFSLSWQVHTHGTVSWMHCSTRRGSPTYADLCSTGSCACDYWAQESFKSIQIMFTLETFLSHSAYPAPLTTPVLLLCKVYLLPFCLLVCCLTDLHACKDYAPSLFYDEPNWNCFALSPNFWAQVRPSECHDPR